MPQESTPSKLTPEQLQEMLRLATEAGNRLDVDEPPLVMPPPLPVADEGGRQG
ncbi:MAG: hypothetical protein ACLGHW_06465 [Gammaproteobacteria bacterium]